MNSFEDEEHNVKRVLPDINSDSSQDAQNYNSLPNENSQSESNAQNNTSNTDAMDATKNADTSVSKSESESISESASTSLDDVHLPAKSTSSELSDTKKTATASVGGNGNGGDNGNGNNSNNDDEDEDSDDDDNDGLGSMPLLKHLGDLRRALTRIVIIILIGFVGCYSIAEPLYAFLSAPLTAALPEGSTLIYTSPQGAFFTYLKVSFMAAILFTTPFTFYQVWAFIAPGLYKQEKAAITPLAIISAFFFTSGATFCYYMVFPIAFKFFIGFTTDMIIPMISVEEYLAFATKLVLAFGLVFEMPLFSFFLSRMGLLKPEHMRKHRKYAILAIFIIAAILTPPDIFSQVLMAGPMCLLYELSIYVAVWARKKPKKTDSDQTDSEPNAE